MNRAGTIWPFCRKGIGPAAMCFQPRLSEQGPDVIQLFAQLAFVDQIGPAGCVFGPVDRLR